MKKLSASLEDYLELIYNLLQNSQVVKAIDIARRLNVSRASVSEALVKLEEKQLIIYEAHKNIQITSEGIKQAENIISKHTTLMNFFQNVLCLDEKESENNACKIEHVISDDVFNRIKLFKDYCLNNQEIIANFEKGL